MAGLVQIVDKVGTGGSVLLDLNRHVGGIMLGARDQVSLAEVELARSDAPFAWSPLADPGAPADLRAREITVPVVLFAGSADAAGALVRKVQQLTRGRFVLKLQRHGSTVPVWLRCMPTVPRLSKKAKELMNETQSAGNYEKIIDLGEYNLNSGAYIIQFQGNNMNTAKKIMIN